MIGWDGMGLDASLPPPTAPTCGVVGGSTSMWAVFVVTQITFLSLISCSPHTQQMWGRDLAKWIIPTCQGKLFSKLFESQTVFYLVISGPSLPDVGRMFRVYGS